MDDKFIIDSFGHKWPACNSGVWIICIKEHYLNNYLMKVGNDGWIAGDNAKENIDRRYWREATDEEIIIIKKQIDENN